LFLRQSEQIIRNTAYLQDPIALHGRLKGLRSGAGASPMLTATEVRSMTGQSGLKNGGNPIRSVLWKASNSPLEDQALA
jgi:hypothetical protein